QGIVKKSKNLVALSIECEPNGELELHRHFENCRNPRVIVPAEAFPGYRDDWVGIDSFSWGIRCPQFNASAPNYGVVGPQVLDWKQYFLWNLIAPRGSKNPSIQANQENGNGNVGLVSEGVGSFGPFVIGDPVVHANVL